MPRVFMYDEPSGRKTITATKIIEDNYQRWCEKMRKKGLEAQISEENCIQDFCVDNWAVEITAGGRNSR